MVYTVRSAAVAAVMVFGTFVQAQSGGSSVAPSSSGPFSNSTSSVAPSTAPPSSSAPPTSVSSMMSSSAPVTTSSTPSSSSSVSSTSSSSTSSGPVPGITSEPGVNQLIGIQQGNNNNNPGNLKRGLGMLKHLARQATGGFVGGAGPVNPQSCADATPFQLINGQLTSGGQVVSVNPGVPYEALAVGGGGSISTTFSFLDGTLHWYNAAFTGGEAGFCQVASGQVYITFQGAANAPAGCAAVTLVVIPQSECQNGVIISATTGSPTSTATFLPQSQGIFPLNASPTNEICVTTTLSFIPGEPTFIGQTI